MLAPTYPTLAAFFVHAYQPIRLIGCAPETIDHYRVCIRHFSRCLGRDALITDLDEDRIAEFLTWFAEGRSAATIWAGRKHLLALAAFAHRKGFLPEVPDIPPVRQLRRVPQAYTVDQVASLLDACRHVWGEISGVPGRLYFAAFFLTAYDTGARAGALWALEWVDLEPPFLIFRAEHAKSREDQILKVSGQTLAALAAIRLPDRRLIFPWSGCRRVKYLRIKAIFKSAGLPHGRRDLLQRIRRTTLTLAHRLGIDATLQAGHSSDSITRRSYLDPTGELQAADVLPRPTVTDRQRRLF